MIVCKAFRSELSKSRPDDVKSIVSSCQYVNNANLQHTRACIPNPCIVFNRAELIDQSSRLKTPLTTDAYDVYGRSEIEELLLIEGSEESGERAREHSNFA